MTNKMVRKPLKFDVAKVEQVIPNVQNLALNHHEEVKDFNISLDMDWNTYIEWEKSDSLKAFTAYHGETLVGYSSFFLFTNHHYQNRLEATQDAIYIVPEFRGNGFEFIGFIDEYLKSIGVKSVHQHVKVNHDWSSTLDKLGYKFTERTYTK